MTGGPTSVRRRTHTRRRTGAIDPDRRIDSSRRKVVPPFQLDPTLCFYSPQENVDALQHPRVSAWLAFIRDRWTPTPVAGARRRIALLLPCTRTKPYPVSREHRSINAGLLAAGWRPVGPSDSPAELTLVLDEGEDRNVLNTSPLTRRSVVLDRFVISEPLGLVPYEHTMFWNGEPAPASGYDDPGLFEHRGTSVSPHRPDCTARQRPDGTWAWGPAEHRAFRQMHHAMVDVLTDALGRLADQYAHLVAWVSPGLTHRSFLLGRVQSAAGLGPDGHAVLPGVLDLHPGLVTVLPDGAQSERARDRLAARLEEQGRRAGPRSVTAVYARGDGHDTPLGLRELVDELVAHLGGWCRGTS